MLLSGYSKRQRYCVGINTLFTLESKILLRHNGLDLMMTFSVLLEPSMRLRESFPKQVDKNLGVSKERGVWNSQGGRKDNFFFVPLHSLGLYNNNVSCLRTVSGKNLLANPIILKCKLRD